ncbi:hypothetical protein PV08_08374 [Exophiala spinifera]|uniref:Methyltransferase domain-containing protein n=1 Tax=Exophiala spinifera TaxID=91928 RepID=A0A0D1ZK31_9EURO|nr:uncharacterized protein PV08_08374 [Exophiala spinifera]KIW13187.1 hypothetical protein PV08_08374 [Exophiala spinifera]
MADSLDDQPTTKVTPIPLYQADLHAVPSDVSALLSSYSGIAPDKQNSHIVRVRDQAYATHPYPCLGRWRFLELDLSSHPLYQSDVLAPLIPTRGHSSEGKPQRDGDDDGRDSWIFLDLGTCLGQDIRKLIYDGADPSRLYGADLKPEFIDAGYELFRDADKLPRDKHFIAPADVFDDSPSTELAAKCDGKVGILHISAVFHLFDLAAQRAMARRCLKLLDPRRGRVLLCGGQVGNVNPGEVARLTGKGSRFRHDERSWRDMWEGVVAEDAWRDKIRGVEVGCEMEGWIDRIEMKTKGLVGDDGKAPGEGLRRKQIGRVEDGFRWMKWWVWVDFDVNVA